ncbi:MAG: lectin like domain-containing protein [Deltaproteobacteria bacterium]|nr:lectin like domain-containing protein [Deltaproteobacteria bacterium]
MIIQQRTINNNKKWQFFCQNWSMPTLSKMVFRYWYLTLCILLITASGFCFEFAPLNPDFVSHLDNLINGREQLQITEYGHPLGHIPSPVDLSHIDRLNRYFDQSVQYPAKYDLRTTGKLTPVRDQGNCGDCWAFATYSSLESYLMPYENWYFSEDDLNNNHGFDPPPCNGGNSYMSMAYLSRYSGPINEVGTTAQVQKHVQKVEYIPRTNYTFNEIKQAVMTYGAIDTSIAWYNSAYKSSNSSYYYNGTGKTNHDVAIVGWDDTYSKSNFITTPQNDGAFIIRNSWGAGWGDGGYFYMSYYDTYAGNNCWAFDNAESPTNYSTIYQYDPLGWVSSLGSKPSSSTGWGANIFTATSSESLKAVSFYALSSNSTYEIDIYSNVTAGMPTSGTLTLTQSGTLSNVGYVTIPLSQPVSLTTGALFSVAIKFVTPGYNYPVPVEKPMANYSSKATYNPGESFFSSNGLSWNEISNSTNKSNVCIKAFAGQVHIAAQVDNCTPDIKANGQDGPITVSSGTPVSITASLSPGNENGKLADWWFVYSSRAGWYSLNSNGWTPGINLLAQYPLLSISPVEIYSSTLPVGDYAFYFLVDMNPNGIVDSPFYYDFVQVHVVN